MKQFVGTLLVIILGSAEDSHLLIVLRCKIEIFFQCIILIGDFETSGWGIHSNDNVQYIFFAIFQFLYHLPFLTVCLYCTCKQLIQATD